MEDWCPLQDTGIGVSGRPWLGGWLAPLSLCSERQWMSGCTWASVLRPHPSASCNDVDCRIRTMLATQARRGVTEGLKCLCGLEYRLRPWKYIFPILTIFGGHCLV